MKNKVEIINLSKAPKRVEAPIKKDAENILKILSPDSEGIGDARLQSNRQKENLRLEIYLIDSGKMKFLNKKFRGKNKTTDILSFKEPENFINPESRQKKIGELYLTLLYIKKEPLIAKLLIHGILHLFGYSHKRKNDRIKMEEKEKLCISRL